MALLSPLQLQHSDVSQLKELKQRRVSLALEGVEGIPFVEIEAIKKGVRNQSLSALFISILREWASEDSSLLEQWRNDQQVVLARIQDLLGSNLALQDLQAFVSTNLQQATDAFRAKGGVEFGTLGDASFSADAILQDLNNVLKILQTLNMLVGLVNEDDCAITTIRSGLQEVSRLEAGSQEEIAQWDALILNGKSKQEQLAARTKKDRLVNVELPRLATEREKFKSRQSKIQSRKNEIIRFFSQLSSLSFETVVRFEMHKVKGKVVEVPVTEDGLSRLMTMIKLSSIGQRISTKQWETVTTNSEHRIPFEIPLVIDPERNDPKPMVYHIQKPHNPFDGSPWIIDYVKLNLRIYQDKYKEMTGREAPKNSEIKTGAYDDGYCLIMDGVFVASFACDGTPDSDERFAIVKMNVERDTLSLELFHARPPDVSAFAPPSEMLPLLYRYVKANISSYQITYQKIQDAKAHEPDIQINFDEKIGRYFVQLNGVLVGSFYRDGLPVSEKAGAWVMVASTSIS